jgi:hypothetical protein
MKRGWMVNAGFIGRLLDGRVSGGACERSVSMPRLGKVWRTSRLCPPRVGRMLSADFDMSTSRGDSFQAAGPR